MGITFDAREPCSCSGYVSQTSVSLGVTNQYWKPEPLVLSLCLIGWLQGLDFHVRPPSVDLWRIEPVST